MVPPTFVDFCGEIVNIFLIAINYKTYKVLQPLNLLQNPTSNPIFCTNF
jgi:hypothetical protein